MGAFYTGHTTIHLVQAFINYLFKKKQTNKLLLFWGKSRMTGCIFYRLDMCRRTHPSDSCNRGTAGTKNWRTTKFYCRFWISLHSVVTFVLVIYCHLYSSSARIKTYYYPLLHVDSDDDDDDDEHDFIFFWPIKFWGQRMNNLFRLLLLLLQ